MQRRLQLAEQLRVPTRAQRGVIAIQLNRKPLHLKGIPHIADPRRVESSKRLTTPQRECTPIMRRRFQRIRAGPGLTCQVPKQVQIDRQCVGCQGVTGGPAADLHVTGGAEQLPQPRQIARQRIAGPARRLVGPHPVDELIHRNGPVDVDEQRREHAPLPRVTDIEPLPVQARLDFTQQPEFHGHRYSVHQ